MDQLFQKNIPVTIEAEMKKSYMEYAMSVIVGRAIPDIRGWPETGSPQGVVCHV